MHFAFTDQQIEFRDAVRQVLAKECTPDDLRSAYAAPAARTARWTTLAELGVIGLSTPPTRGGLGLGLVDLVPLLEEMGRVALPEPVLETTALAAPLLAGLEGGTEGGSASVARWLRAIAEGTTAAAVGRVGPDGPPLAGADGADLYLLVTSGDQPEIHAVGSEAVTVTPVGSLDPTRRLGTVGWDPDPGTVVASGGTAAQFIRQMSDRAAVATAAELLGLTERMITMAADYAKERHQFGKPIGGFQAVKHLLAGAQVKLEFARPVVYGAAWALDAGDPTTSRAASTAKAWASDAATEAARVALQVHGAIGYTWEHDLHLWMKKGWTLASAWGDAAWHRRRVADWLLGPTV
jgi:alkylation response protein AidB-like acyl-CoA dehydrogenase